jgi:alpha-glucosidase (family GH31 glycosyl hydrolase)
VEVGEFTDEPTQTIWFRDIDRPKFAKRQVGNNLYIETLKVRFCFNTKLKKLTKVVFISEDKTVKCFVCKNLKGTRRTLDFTIGKVPLQKGLMSYNGVAVHDDSKSLLLIDGLPVARTSKCSDKYYFAYNREYQNCLVDFFKLTGKSPLIPRYALGNWWSRYKAYTQNEYIALMERFKKKSIPITVATIDMDWHWVDVQNKFNYRPIKGNMETLKPGWTGYSWNTDLFPDYMAFLKYLHENNMKTTLNLHPADGVRYFEDMYEEMAQEMGIDPLTKKPVEFDITNSKFINAYFKILHNPYEKDGVDFWWIDWQQGKKTKLKGLDPLWALNHYHYLNSQRDSSRPLILSRYAGIGGHRYPLGFSGDSTIKWCTLRFQPYFTATAANVGYFWWSHDIGGHMLGKKDDEMFLRWVQFGVFSPILRLHSTSHDLQGKEPWNYSDIVEELTVKALRFRHRLIPYIYSMNYLSHKDGVPLCKPMYYDHPAESKAYKYNNQYYFGTELIVAPVVSKIKKSLSMAKTDVWLPKGRWTDIFSGRKYTGGKVVSMMRGLSQIPVLAKEGAIIPLSTDGKQNDWSNPRELSILIFSGQNQFELYEDDGQTKDYEKGKYVKTKFSLKEGNALQLTINKAEGDLTLVPEERTYHLCFKDLEKGDVKVFVNNSKIDPKIDLSDGLNVTLVAKPLDFVKVIIENFEKKTNGDPLENARNILSRYQRKNIIKMLIYKRYKHISTKDKMLAAIKRDPFLPKIVKCAVIEAME